ncbi:Hypothetical protein, putative [Bodo saltans]|uniref:Uncharacterized protein n=1 Tax=Bodo saltans TaxID=75058 RepID=A0A0S4IPR0_BODSA|nr:Hypothetical protein, putative [Bodo saltans]|eukprot:CUE99748.1 Hypothetical protein, putative [Bodo saltans]
MMSDAHSITTHHHRRRWSIMAGIDLIAIDGILETKPGHFFFHFFLSSTL